MLAAPWGTLRYGGIVDLCAIFAVCTCRADWALWPLWSSVAGVSFRALLTLRATLALYALGPLFPLGTGFALRAGGTSRTGRADFAALTLRTSRADGARIAFVSFVALKVAVGDAVFERFQAVSGLLGALPGLFGRCPGLLCCRLCIGLGLLCGGGIGVHGSGVAPSSVPELALTR